MLVYINDKEDEEFNTRREYAYVYEYNDDYPEEENSDVESTDYEIDYEVSEGYI